MKERPEEMRSRESDDFPFEDVEPISSPDSYDFRPLEPDKYAVDLEGLGFVSGFVDAANLNTEFRFEDQGVRERYFNVFHEGEVSLVESYRAVNIDGVSSETEVYYLVAGEDVYRFDGSGYVCSLNERPLEVARAHEEVLNRFRSGDLDELDWGSGCDEECVPPPEGDGYLGL